MIRKTLARRLSFSLFNWELADHFEYKVAIFGVSVSRVKQALESNPDLIAPEGYTLDAALIERPGNKDIQLDLFLDYANDVRLYPDFQKYFRDSQLPLLAIWGKHDPYFILAGAEAFRRDNPNATVQLLDTGHFALETHVEEIAGAMRHFLTKTAG